MQELRDEYIIIYQSLDDTGKHMAFSHLNEWKKLSTKTKKKIQKLIMIPLFHEEITRMTTMDTKQRDATLFLLLENQPTRIIHSN